MYTYIGLRSGFCCRQKMSVFFVFVLGRIGLLDDWAQYQRPFDFHWVCHRWNGDPGILRTYPISWIMKLHLFNEKKLTRVFMRDFEGTICKYQGTSDCFGPQNSNLHWLHFSEIEEIQWQFRLLGGWFQPIYAKNTSNWIISGVKIKPL